MIGDEQSDTAVGIGANAETGAASTMAAPDVEFAWSTETEPEAAFSLASTRDSVSLESVVRDNEMLAAPTGVWLGVRTMSWWTAIAVASIIILVAVTAIVWLVFLLPRQTHSPTTPKPSTTSVPSAVPVTKPATWWEEQINNAFTETIDGSTTLAYAPVPVSGGNGTPEDPAMRIQGSPDQRADVINKLAARGIRLSENTSGTVTGVAFDSDDAKEGWRYWYERYMLMPIQPPSTAPPATTVPQSTGNQRESNAADNTYLTAIEAAGIRLPDRIKAIDVGRSQCDFLAFGSDPAGAALTAYLNVQNEYPTLSAAQAKTVERAAVYAYCPKFASILPTPTG